VENLGAVHEISALGRRELDLMDSDRVLDVLRAKKFDAVVHAATYDAAPKHSVKDPAKVMESNLRMFFNLVRGRQHFGKLIYFGSGAEFGREYWKPKMTEAYFDEHVPSDQYGFSKYMMTKHAFLSWGIYNLRLFGVFGKYDDWRTRFIPNACCQAVLDRPIKMERNRLRDFLFVGDLARIVRWFLEHTPKESAYNVCSGDVRDYEGIARDILRISGKNSLGTKSAFAGLGPEYSGDNSRLLAEIEGFTFTPFESALTGLYEWHSSNARDIDAAAL
jgi:GDP-L-fucose synthase